MSDKEKDVIVFLANSLKNSYEIVEKYRREIDAWVDELKSCEEKVARLENECHSSGGEDELLSDARAINHVNKLIDNSKALVFRPSLESGFKVKLKPGFTT